MGSVQFVTCFALWNIASGNFIICGGGGGGSGCGGCGGGGGDYFKKCAFSICILNYNNLF